MSSLTVLIIRHGEKPEPDAPELGPGLTVKGKEDRHSLVIRGWQRAGAWATLFATPPSADFPKPDIILFRSRSAAAASARTKPSSHYAIGCR